MTDEERRRRAAEEWIEVFMANFARSSRIG
jgi:hypothetical protein